MKNTANVNYYEKSKWYLLSFTLLFQICPSKSVVFVEIKLFQS